MSDALSELGKLFGFSFELLFTDCISLNSEVAEMQTTYCISHCHFAAVLLLPAFLLRTFNFAIALG